MSSSGQWKSYRLSEVGRFLGGATPSTSVPEYWSGDIHWATSKVLGPGYTLRCGERFISSRAVAESSSSLVPKGNVIVGTRVGVGKTAVNSLDMAISQDLTGIVVDVDRFDPYFLAFCLAQPMLQAEFAGRERGTTIQGIPRGDLESLVILAPCLADQRTIASVLKRAHVSLEVEVTAQAVASDLKRSTMSELFKRGLRREAQKDSDIGLVPESWEVVPLGSLGRIGNGSTPRKSDEQYWEGGRFPWLTSAKVYDREITAADQFVTETALRECHLPIVEPGAVLIAITGQGKTLGHSAVLRTRATLNQHLAYLATDLDRADPSFVRGYLETQYQRFRQVGAGGGSTKGALTCAYLRSVPIPLPRSLGEQREIAAILDAMDRKIDLHRRKRAVLDELFKALLHKLMTGEIGVTDLNLDALAETLPSPGASS